MAPEAREVDTLAKRLSVLARQVLDNARQPVWGVEWDWDDEDALRDAASGVERYEHWEETGEHGYSGLRPGLEPHIALADSILLGLSSVLRYWDHYGDPLDDELVSEATGVMQRYVRARQLEGGPGLVNAETWQR